MIDLRKINLDEFENKCLNMYESLFPKEERRKFDSIITSYLDGIEIFYIIELDNKPIGFISLEHLSNHPYYLEYFGIIKEYQGMGYWIACCWLCSSPLSRGIQSGGGHSRLLR